MRRVNVPRSTRSYREHDVSLSDFTVTLDLFFRDHPTGRMISEVDLINRSPRLDVRAHRGWPVAFSYRGQSVEHWVKPDRFTGAEFSDRPKSRNTRYYAIELDRGTMPLEAASLEKASILRKLLSYETTIADRILEDFFLIPHCHVLFLTIGKRRRGNMVELASRIVGSDRAAEAMFFAVQPQSPSVGFSVDLPSIEWINGLGEAVRLSV